MFWTQRIRENNHPPLISPLSQRMAVSNLALWCHHWITWICDVTPTWWTGIVTSFVDCPCTRKLTQTWYSSMNSIRDYRNPATRISCVACKNKYISKYIKEYIYIKIYIALSFYISLCPYTYIFVYKKTYVTFSFSISLCISLSLSLSLYIYIYICI